MSLARRPRPLWTGWRRIGLVTMAGLGLLLSGPAGGLAQSGRSGGPGGRFHILFSSSLFQEIPESDARAAVRVWAETFVRERHIEADPEPLVFDDIATLLAVVRARQDDLVTISTLEYLSLGAEAVRDSFLADASRGHVLKEYLLLVHQDSPARGLADLARGRLLVQQNIRSCLAIPWLDTCLLQAGFPPASEHFGTVRFQPKLSNVVLPVFFRQADACLVTRSGFETMIELNPQVGKLLRPIVTSPGFLPSVTYVRPRTNGSLGPLNLRSEILRLQDTPQGQQMLRLFQVDRLVLIPPTMVDSARELMATHRRLTDRWKARNRDSRIARASVLTGAGP